MCKTPQTVYFGLIAFSLSSLGLSLLAQEPDLASKIYAEASKSVLLLLVKSEQGHVLGQGTGFVVQGGKIVTNEHVVRQGLVFIDLGAVRLRATVERVDALSDLALLTSTAELALKPLLLNAATPSPGTGVFAIGNPAGLERSISTGVVSGVRDFKGRQLLQITAPISPGSSGGPILNGRGEVVGVAVGLLEGGQNLNFAIPAEEVRKLLAGDVRLNTAGLSLIAKIGPLLGERGQHEYSSDPGSQYQRLTQQIDAMLQSALDGAGSDVALLLEIADLAHFFNEDIAIAAAERAVRVKPSAEGYLRLAQCLTSKATIWADVPDQGLLERAEKAIRAALRVAKQPTAEMYCELGDILESRESYLEAETSFRRALELSKTKNDVDSQVASLRGLARTTHSLGKAAESDEWFKSLLETGKVTADDWEQHGYRLDRRELYRQAGRSYKQAAVLGGSWTNWCEAAGSFGQVGGEEDEVLDCARKCLAEGSRKKDSESRLASAHLNIAVALNDRGVYQEALSHAREATVLSPTDPWAFGAQAAALIGLRRFQEAINSSTQAIRLSDGKYSTLHFQLGSAYFGVENWGFARQSYEKAAKLDLKDSAAPYNVAVCLSRLGFLRDAANWYEEVLRRAPNRGDRQEILSRIQGLRR